jgi:hypothetical protein
VKRSAAGPEEGADPDARLRPAITVRNVALAVLGPAVLVLKSAYNGPFEDALNAYAVGPRPSLRNQMTTTRHLHGP